MWEKENQPWTNEWDLNWTLRSENKWKEKLVASHVKEEGGGEGGGRRKENFWSFKCTVF